MCHVKAQEEQIHLLLPGTAVSRKIGFPDVIMPGEDDDVIIFVTLYVAICMIFAHFQGLSFDWLMAIM